MVLVVYQPALQYNEPHLSNNQLNTPGSLPMCFGYAFFAFMLTWMREIVKDMEDYKGDEEQGCVTMPIKMGLQYSVRFIKALNVITVASLAFATAYFICVQNFFLGVYLLVMIIIPLIAWSRFLSKANTQHHYHSASRWLKIIMLSGISSLIIYHFKAYNIL